MTLADSTKDVVAVATAKKEDVKNPKDLVNQDDALTVYLASLLSKPVSEEAAEQTITAMPVTESPVFKTDAESKASVSASSHCVSHLSQNTSANDQPLLMPESMFDDKFKPEPELIKKTHIRCLSAVVSGLKVLIPAESVHSIKNVTHALTPSAKMPVWLYEFNDGEDEAIQVVNTKKLMFDSVKSQRIKPDARTYVILIDDGSWGLSCDAVGEVIALTKPDITWRGRNTKRRWLAGTSHKYEAVLLDVHKIETSLID